MDAVSVDASLVRPGPDSMVNESAILRRPRLLERLRHETLQRITLIAAPAGYGKSVLLREYASQSDGVPKVIFRVRSGNQSALGFVRGFVDALGGVGLSPPLREYVYSNGSRNKGRLLEWFLDSLSGFCGMIILDDLHLAAINKGVADFIARIIDESPLSVRWIVAARTLSRLPVASWMARGEAGVPITDAELSLSDTEAATISEACGIEDPHVRDHLAKLAKGWPVALSFAIRLAANGHAPGGIARATSTFVYQLLAEQVLGTLQPAQREFLLGTCLLPRLDPDSLAQHWQPDAPEIVRSLQRDVAFTIPDEQGSYLYHDLFKDFLRAELLKEPAIEVGARVRKALAYLMTTEAYDAAIDLCVEMNAEDAAVRTLEEIGFLLIDSGCIDIVERATSMVKKGGGRYPIVTALTACVESCHGNYVRADELYLDARRDAGGALRPQVELRHAVDLLNRREYREAGLILDAFRFEALSACELRADALGVAAFAAAQSGQHERARDLIEEALRLSSRLQDVGTVALAHHRAALVFYSLTELGRARSLAASAVLLADRSRIAGLAARARLSLAVISGEQGDLPRQNETYRELRERGKAASDRNLTFVALMDSLWAETEAGNISASDALIQELAAFDPTLFRRSEDTLISAYALRSSWGGDFRAAYYYVKDTAERLTTTPRRASRYGEIALYAAAAGLTQEAAAAQKGASSCIEEADGSSARSLSRMIMARTFLALSYVMSARLAEAEVELSSVSFTSGTQMANFSPLVNAAKALSRLKRGDRTDFAETQQHLRRSLLGGYALLIERLKSGIEERERVGKHVTLSASERLVLAHVERGLSSKEIATAMSRSAQTVDTHVKSILRKLRCRGRSEAVYVARRRGLLD